MSKVAKFIVNAVASTVKRGREIIRLTESAPNETVTLMYDSIKRLEATAREVGCQQALEELGIARTRAKLVEQLDRPLVVLGGAMASAMAMLQPAFLMHAGEQHVSASSQAMVDCMQHIRRAQELIFSSRLKPQAATA